MPALTPPLQPVRTLAKFMKNGKVLTHGSGFAKMDLRIRIGSIQQDVQLGELASESGHRHKLCIDLVLVSSLGIQLQTNSKFPTEQRDDL